MNERLNHLIERARHSVPPEVSFDHGLQEYSKKLATSIILECADWSDNKIGKLSDQQRVELLQHFGIE